MNCFLMKALLGRFFDSNISPNGDITSYKNFDFEGYDSDNISYDLETAKYELESAKADLLKSRGEGFLALHLGYRYSV